jgi:hypothetical protein
MNPAPAVSKLRHRLFTTGYAVLGGGVAGAFTAAMDPAKYHFPHDFGSGKLIKYFFMGAFLTLGGLVLHSPWGHKMMAGYRKSQEHIEDCAHDDLEDAAEQR